MKPHPRFIAPLLAGAVGIVALVSAGRTLLAPAADPEPLRRPALVTVMPDLPARAAKAPAPGKVLQGAPDPVFATESTLPATAWSFQPQLEAKWAETVLPSPVTTAMAQSGVAPSSALWFALAQHFVLLRGLPQRPAQQAADQLDRSAQCVLTLSMLDANPIEAVPLMALMEQQLALDPGWRSAFEKLPQPTQSPLADLDCHLLD